MQVDDLRRALREAGDTPTGDVAPARAAVGARARSLRIRRRSAWSTMGAVAAAALVLAFFVLPNDHDQRVFVGPRPGEATTTVPSPVKPVASATAAQVVAGHWQTLPPAPIPARSGASVVWTGHELIVWGGTTTANEFLADGAAYNPATKAWRRLASSPLSPRIGQAAVWTGTEMIIWGGTDDATGGSVTGSGAAYDPSTDTWRMIAVSPLDGRHDALAVWTGDRMIMLGGDGFVEVKNGGAAGDSGTQHRSDGASYDPTTDRWEKLPAAPSPSSHPSTWRGAMQAGPERLLAWSHWETTTINGPASTTAYGANLFVFDEATDDWRVVPNAANALLAPQELLWTGERVIVRGTEATCDSCPGPFAAEATGRYDPATNTWERLPPDPLGGDNMASVWTGSALLSFDSSFSATSAAGSVVPGDASVYDPEPHAWSRLSRAPLGCSTDDPIWTGEEVLMYCANSFPDASGLAYVPGAPG